MDTNILVYARRAEMPLHAQAYDLLKTSAEGAEPWAILWPCICEFLRVVTHPRVFNPPTKLSVALLDLDRLFDSPSLVLLGEGTTHRIQLREVIEASQVTGNLIHDAHIAALCIEHGVSELLTADGDFARFTGLRARNPFKA